MKLTKGNLDTLDYNMGQYTQNLNDYYGPGLQIDKRTRLVPRLFGDDVPFMFKEGDKMRIPGVLDFTGAKYPFKKKKSLKVKSGIKIKKKNRGKFTEYCGGNVTQECINRAKHSGNKTLIKRATFAQNARKWNK